MQPVDKIYSKFMKWLAEGRPFTFARFNDGEMMAITATSKKIARGDQVVTPTVTSELATALSYRNAGVYWLGGPCRTCYPKLRKAFDRWTQDYPSTVQATVFCNGGRWPRFVRDVFRGLKGKAVVGVCGVDQKIDPLMELIGVRSFEAIRASTTNSFDRLEQLETYLNGQVELRGQDHTVFIFTCGPVGRALAAYGCRIAPQHTWLELGSSLDPLTRGVWHRCHTGDLPRCPECNRV